jgi:hypothetical protein
MYSAWLFPVRPGSTNTKGASVLFSSGFSQSRASSPPSFSDIICLETHFLLTFQIAVNLLIKRGHHLDFKKTT